MRKITIYLSLIFLNLLLVSNICLADLSTTCPSGSVCIDNPLGETDPNILIGKVINSILGIVGSLALAMFIYGGLIWMTSAGNSEKVKKGQEIIAWA